MAASPIVEGKVRSSFAMTEPAPGGGSDPSMIKTYAEKHGDTWKIYGRKWFITGAGGGLAFHPRGAHLRRQAQGHHHVPLSQGPARLANRAPHRDHGAGGARRPLRARVRRPRGARRRRVRRRRQRAQGRAGAARPGAADALHALARLVEALHRDRAGVRQSPRRLRHQARRPRERADEARRGRPQHPDRPAAHHARGLEARSGRFRAQGSLDGQGAHAPTRCTRPPTSRSSSRARAAIPRTPSREWVYRAARAARLVDGADEVHKMVLAKFMREEGRDFWSWSAGNRV